MTFLFLRTCEFDQNINKILSEWLPIKLSAKKFVAQSENVSATPCKLKNIANICPFSHINNNK